MSRIYFCKYISGTNFWKHTSGNIFPEIYYWKHFLVIILEINFQNSFSQDISGNTFLEAYFQKHNSRKFFLGIYFWKYISGIRFLLPEIYSKDLFPEVYFWKCVSGNIFSERCFQDYISRNIFLEIDSRKYISRNMLPEIYVREYISRRTNGPCLAMIGYSTRAMDTISSQITALNEIFNSRQPPWSNSYPKCSFTAL